VILDPGDPRLDGFRRLNEPRFRRRYEEQTGVFIAEGPTVVTHVAANAADLIDAVLVDSRRRERVPTGLDVPVYEGPQSLLSSIVGFEFHRGILALCRRPPFSSVSHISSLGSLAVLEGVNDHENLGAIIRAAAGLGVEGILLDPSTADPWYRRSVRVAMGAVVDIPMARSGRWPDDLELLAGMTLVAATPDPSAVDIRSVGKVERPAVMLGAEGLGLSEEAVSRAAIRVRIPMRRGIDSLNVGQAAAVMFDRLLG
jgi:tRNA G18 (ribose-2'-O)-methylase SpoU